MNDQSKLLNDEQYTVYHPKEICQILNELARNKTILSVSFNHGHDQCLTTIIGIDAGKQAVYLDVGLDAGFNSRLLESNHMIFSKNDGIRIRWNSTKIFSVKLKDGAALKIALPKSMIRMQRREYYRCTTSVTNPLICQVPYHSASGYKTDNIFELVLVDMSLGGIGAVISDHLPPAIEIGKVFEGCKLELPDFGVMNISLCVRNITEITLRNGVSRHRVGLQFIDLPSADERLLQRYVFNLEREAMALTKATQE